jgi:hypothetical protein
MIKGKRNMEKHRKLKRVTQTINKGGAKIMSLALPLFIVFSMFLFLLTMVLLSTIDL